MGSGKSSLGKKLATQLGYRFYDLDKLIEAAEGKTISQIFEQDGEDYFRTVESQVLNDALASDDLFVMALGGGTPCFNSNMDVILDQSTAIYLKYNAGILASRLKQGKDSRPLIAGKSDDELLEYVKASLQERSVFYEKCQLIAEDDNLNAAKVIALLEQAM